MGAFRSLLRRLRADRAGVTAIEIALLMPVLVILLLGGAEASRYVLLYQKLDRAATTMGDLVAQAPTLAVSDFTSLFPIVADEVQPYWTTGGGIVVVSAVVNQNSVPTVAWQMKGAGTYSVASRIGVSGGTATLPTGLTVAVGDTIIATEVFFLYQPLFTTNIIPTGVVYHTSFYRPRLATLNTLN